MVQHLLLTMVAAPLLVLAAPITLLLRVASPEARRRWILPVLHSRIVRVVSYPLVAWVLFAGVMWFTPLLAPLRRRARRPDAAPPGARPLPGDRAALLVARRRRRPQPASPGLPGAALLPGPGHALSSFLGLVIFSAETVLYPHYLTLVRDWGPTPLEDQQWAGGIMWAGGDLAFVLALRADGGGLAASRGAREPPRGRPPGAPQGRTRARRLRLEGNSGLDGARVDGPVGSWTRRSTAPGRGPCSRGGRLLVAPRGRHDPFALASPLARPLTSFLAKIRNPGGVRPGGPRPVGHITARVAVRSPTAARSWPDRNRRGCRAATSHAGRSCATTSRDRPTKDSALSRTLPRSRWDCRELVTRSVPVAGPNLSLRHRSQGRPRPLGGAPPSHVACHIRNPPPRGPLHSKMERNADARRTCE